MLQSGRRLYASPLQGTWYDIGRHSDFARGQIEIAAGISHLVDGVELKGSSVVQSSWQAASATVNQSARLDHSVIHANAFVGEEADVSHCIIMRGARVEAGAVLRGCILPPGAQYSRDGNTLGGNYLAGYAGDIG